MKIVVEDTNNGGLQIEIEHLEYTQESYYDKDGCFEVQKIDYGGWV